MSMLAEPRRKQKWSLNPRGKDWAQDANKFGQKMLEKMGWSQGKGLGAKEDGITDHIKVNYKNDSKGMGYKESDNQWTEHEMHFTALLESLGTNGGDTNHVKLSSLEEKSQSSRVRVHYKKFTRGKDLSKYSEKDLANIFGKKSLKENPKKKHEQVIEEPSELKATQESIMFSNAGSMTDYFKKKIPNFGKTNSYVVGNNGVLKKDDSESESELRRPSFGFGFKTMNDDNLHTEAIKSNFISYINENSDLDVSKKKKNKKKRELAENDISDVTPSKRKKREHEDSSVKKKSKSKNKNEGKNGLSNPGFDPVCSDIKIEKSNLGTIEEICNESLNSTIDQVSEKLEVKAQIHTIPIQNIDQSDSFVLDENKQEIKKEKKRKLKENLEIPSKKQMEREDHFNGIDNPLFHVSIQSEDVQALTESLSNDGIKNKKKKSKKKIDNGLDNPVFNVSIRNEEVSTEDSLNSEIEGKRKKKSKKDKHNNSLDNCLFNGSVECDSNVQIANEVSSNGEFKNKKAKKLKKEKKNCGLENPVFNEADSSPLKDIMNGEFEIQRKDKSKKKRKHQEGVDNPALNLNDTIEENCDLMLNIVTTPVINREHKSEESFSIKKINGIKRRKSVRFSDVTRERIIPNKDDIDQVSTLDASEEIVELEGKLNDSTLINPKKSKKLRKGLENDAFDYQANNIEENITSISDTLDKYEAEIENDLNEAKLKSVELDEVMVGEVGNPDGTNEILQDGTVKLKFKHIQFKKQSIYTSGLTGPKKSYKHLIKGDIVLGFKHTNLHEINGYATKSVGK